MLGKGVGAQHVLYLFIHERHILKATRCNVSPAECEETYIAVFYDMDEPIKNTLTWEVNFEVATHEDRSVINSITLFCNGHKLYVSRLRAFKYR